MSELFALSAESSLLVGGAIATDNYDGNKEPIKAKAREIKNAIPPLFKANFNLYRNGEFGVKDAFYQTLETALNENMKIFTYSGIFLRTQE